MNKRERQTKRKGQPRSNIITWEVQIDPGEEEGPKEAKAASSTGQLARIRFNCSKVAPHSFLISSTSFQVSLKVDLHI